MPSGDVSNLFNSEESRKRAVEARRAAIPKGVFVQAVRSFCIECYGAIPSDCGGDHMFDGTECPLFPVRMRKEAKKTTKTKVKRAIRLMCEACVGTGRMSDCKSPDCALRPYAPKERP